MATSVATLSSPPPVSLPLLSSSRSSFFSNCFTVTIRPNNRSLVAIRPRIRQEPTRKRLTCNALFGLGVPELAVIAGVAALLFGPKKLPEIGKSIGKTVKSFQQAAKEFESELKTEPEDSVADSSQVAMSNKEEEKKTEVSSSSKENV
ncbi:Sec-independent protein translocase protein TatA/E [Arabidopsis thaliana x Arabidopsis arenosa]|uniref:Sec-independent protein translocase protein TatA/E n=1 Tax=Arabidopsis thaliana x Arabidopsis arenosa TaxID=1240361 RepID=A0A8T1Z1E3_9BRAS|nr:Sec-independent protein translocase protein TatA/E [Arabidopsis thaliana x Arabidopsis arenosa]